MQESRGQIKKDLHHIHSSNFLQLEQYSIPIVVAIGILYLKNIISIKALECEYFTLEKTKDCSSDENA